MTDEGTGPIDLDVSAIDPPDMARLLVSRACEDAPMAWAEIHRDGVRYPHHGDLVVQLTGFVEQLLGVIAAPRGQQSRDVWRDLMLGEARP